MKRIIILTLILSTCIFNVAYAESLARQIINMSPELKAMQDEADKHKEVYFEGIIKDLKYTDDRRIKVIVQTQKNELYSGTIYFNTYNGTKTTSGIAGMTVEDIFVWVYDCVSTAYDNGKPLHFELTDDDQLTVYCNECGYVADPIYFVRNNQIELGLCEEFYSE